MRPRNQIAVDAHKASFTFCVFDNGEVVVGPSRRPNNLKTVQDLVRQFPRRVVVVEACGVHEWMTDAWLEEGAEVFVAKPFKQERLGEKSDRRDSVRLGQRYMSGELKRVYHMPAKQRLERSIVRERSFLVKRRTQLVNHIKHELNRWNLADLDIKNPSGIVERLPYLASNLELLPVMDGHVKRLDALVRVHGKGNPVVRRLATIPGFGDVVSLAFFTEVGDVSRFPGSQNLVKYLGLDPVWSQSGDKLVDARRISKAGRPLLRGLLVQAAWAHVNFAPESGLAQTYHRLCKTKPKGVAIIAIARRLAEIGWSVWKHEREFTMIRPAPLAT